MDVGVALEHDQDVDGIADPSLRRSSASFRVTAPIL
jgi:hypothetical protein